MIEGLSFLVESEVKDQRLRYFDCYATNFGRAKNRTVWGGGYFIFLLPPLRHSHAPIKSRSKPTRVHVELLQLAYAEYHIHPIELEADLLFLLLEGLVPPPSHGCPFCKMSLVIFSHLVDIITKMNYHKNKTN